MFKKISGVLIGVALTTALVACGDTSEKSDEVDKETVATSSEPAVETKSEEVSSKPVVETKAEDTPTKAPESNETFYVDALEEALPLLTEDQVQLNKESHDFIVDNSNLLPAKTDEEIKTLKEKTQAVDLKLLNKNVAPYYSTLTSFEGYVVQIEEENYDNGETASWVNIGDGNGNNQIYYSYKGTGDILEEDYVKFYGLPLGKYSYETLEGGYQNAQVFFGGHIEKIQ